MTGFVPPHADHLLGGGANLYSVLAFVPAHEVSARILDESGDTSEMLARSRRPSPRARATRRTVGNTAFITGMYYHRDPTTATTADRSWTSDASTLLGLRRHPGGLSSPPSAVQSIEDAWTFSRVLSRAGRRCARRACLN